MIDGNTGRIMLIDFGIARWVTKNEKDVTAVGTMGYAPPELFSGNVEPRSDIYSLGATMFHLLTGADPQSNPLLIFDFSKNPRPRQVNPAVSNEMEHILMRAVEYNVELRYNSAEELREALIGHLERVRYGQLSYGQPQAGPPAQAGAISGQNLVFCGFCGEKIIENDVFCPFCGAKQAVADQVRKTPFGQIVQPKRVLARVTVLGTGELNPPTYDLEKESNVVGRRDPQTNIFPEVDLSKFDPQTKISRRHARIWKEGETFMIEDLGSSNGTVVVSSMNEANKLSPHQPQILIHGSKLVLGDTTLHFVVG
jgi:serine/threonine-protein kinase